MKYTRLAIVAIFFIALVFWLRQCSSPVGDTDVQSTLDNLKKQAGSVTQTETQGVPPAPTATTPKPAAGN